jgi:hypothetical protein
VRENRTHGSEGGGAGYSTGSSYPYLAAGSEMRPRPGVLAAAKPKAEQGHGETRPDGRGVSFPRRVRPHMAGGSTESGTWFSMAGIDFR